MIKATLVALAVAGSAGEQPQRIECSGTAYTRYGDESPIITQGVISGMTVSGFGMGVMRIVSRQDDRLTFASMVSHGEIDQDSGDTWVFHNGIKLELECY